MKKLKSYSPMQIAFAECVAILGYIFLITQIMINSEGMFEGENQFLAPVLALFLFSTSALICSFLTFAYPIWAFWEEKNTKRALRVIFNQILIMALATLGVLIYLLV